MKLIPIKDGRCAIVDNEDYERLNKYRWCVNAQGYLVTRIYTGSGRKNNTGFLIRMHRMVMNAPEDSIIDHKFGKKFDNRKSSLRIATNSENTRNRGKQINNTSGYKGVSFMEFNSKGYKLKKPWVARIQTDNKYISLGMFDTPLEAALAYDMAALEHHGKFARLNI